MQFGSQLWSFYSSNRSASHHTSVKTKEQTHSLLTNVQQRWEEQFWSKLGNFFAFIMSATFSFWILIPIFLQNYWLMCTADDTWAWEINSCSTTVKIQDNIQERSFKFSFFNRHLWSKTPGYPQPHLKILIRKYCIKLQPRPFFW